MVECIRGEMSVSGDRTAQSAGVEKNSRGVESPLAKNLTRRAGNVNKKDLPQVVGTRGRPYSEGDFASNLPVFGIVRTGHT